MQRGSGILLHITSLPSGYHCGDLGPAAYHFVDFLAQSGQKYWQILPLLATNAGVGYSPYSCNSAFANNHLLISPQELLHKGYLTELDLSLPPSQSNADFPKKKEIIEPLLKKAFKKFDPNRDDFKKYCEENKFWLDDWATYSCLKDDHQGQSWNNWPDQYKFCEGQAIEKYITDNKMRIVFNKFIQFVFDEQWKRLTDYAREKDIRIVGDIPIYLNYDSCDVWARPDVFKLNQGKAMDVVSGVPPDYFSEDGQLWGNPLYDWEWLSSDNFTWWVERLKRNEQLFDLSRIDHFRGLVAYWEVEAGQTTAINGHWQDVPVEEFLNQVFAQLPDIKLIAENLGVITEDVTQVRLKYGLPGMKVLQFAFDGNKFNAFLPHMYEPNNIVYTGTHDNNTTKGWFKYELSNQNKRQLEKYCGQKIYKENICETMIRLALGSVADAAIIPMQDVLELNEDHRMNKPGSVDGNWRWRYIQEQLTVKKAENLYQLTLLYGRTCD